MGEETKELVKYITTGNESVQDKTRIMSKEQLIWTHQQMFIGEQYDFPWMKAEAQEDARLMMGFKGLRSDDVRDMAIGLDKAEKERKGGAIIAADAKERGKKNEPNRPTTQ